MNTAFLTISGPQHGKSCIFQNYFRPSSALCLVSLVILNDCLVLFDFALWVREGR